VTWEADARVAGSRVARLATVGSQGAPRLVPITFAVLDGRIVTVVDGKPKTRTALRRLDDIAADPRVTVLVDHYDEDWSRLWWVRLDGRARVEPAGPVRAAVVAALRAKYEQYRVGVATDGPAILIDVLRARSWSAVP
jgi:PPOX class probable F420-dependent enzyme